MTSSTRGGAPHRRARQRQSRRALLFAPSSQHLVAAELSIVVLCAAGVLAGITSTVVLGIALLVGLVPFVVVGGRPLFRWAATGRRFLANRTPSAGVTTEHTDASGGVGIHWNGTRITCVARLIPPAGSITVLGRSRADVAEALPLASMAACLDQHDIRLAGIDVISLGARSASGSHATDVYERLIGPLPAVADRTVWIAVSLDLRHNADAVAARGGERTGAARAITIATTRVVRAVRAAGLDARILGPDDIDAVASSITRGVAPGSLTQTWNAAPLPGASNSGFGIDCRTLTSETLAEIWAVPTLATSLAIGLRTGDHPGDIALSASCRFTTRTPLDTVPLPGLISMRGRQRDALVSHLPFADATLDHLAHRASVQAHLLDRLRVPVAGCGQLLGSDSAGNGIAGRIHGVGIRSVVVAGELYIAQQLMFRATAVGARILIRSDRPHAWVSLVDSVAGPDRLYIDGGPIRPTGRFDVVLLDYADAFTDRAASPTAGVTVITLTEHLPRTPFPDPDVVIVQPGASGDRIRVRSKSADLELILVTIPQETAFIGRPRSIGTPASA